MTTYPLGLAEFKSWLESKDESEVVGKLHLFDFCPIANALKIKTKAKHIKVRSYVTVADDWGTVFNPSWVTGFIVEVDSLAKNRRDVTAKKSLQIVNNLHICTVCNKYNLEGTSCSRESCPW